MCCVHETKLDTGDGASIPVSEQHALSESGLPTPPAHFTHDALPLLADLCHLLRRDRLQMHGTIEETKDVCVAPVSVKYARVRGVCHEHIRADADGYFVVALPMKTQAVCLGSPKLLAVDLDRWRAGCKGPVTVKIKSREEVDRRLIANEEGGAVRRNR